MSKCAGCDQHNAVIYHKEDMYCHDCYYECLDGADCLIDETNYMLALKEQLEMLDERFDNED